MCCTGFSALNSFKFFAIILLQFLLTITSDRITHQYITLPHPTRATLRSGRVRSNQEKVHQGPKNVRLLLKPTEQQSTGDGAIILLRFLLTITSDRITHQYITLPHPTRATLRSGRVRSNQEKVHQGPKNVRLLLKPTEQQSTGDDATKCGQEGVAHTQ